MDYHLVCTRPFGKYKIGDTITEDEEAATVPDHNEHCFVRRAIPAGFAPVVEPEPVAEETPSTRSIPRQT